MFKSLLLFFKSLGSVRPKSIGFISTRIASDSQLKDEQLFFGLYNYYFQHFSFPRYYHINEMIHNSYLTKLKTHLMLDSSLAWFHRAFKRCSVECPAFIVTRALGTFITIACKRTVAFTYRAVRRVGARSLPVAAVHFKFT